MEEYMVKVGDIIDGRRVTRVYDLCGSLAYDTEPVEIMPEPQEPFEEPEKPKRRIRRKKEQ